MEVGVRELRNHLSRYLHRMRYSDEVVVTDRGRAIARVVTPARQPKRPAAKPIRTRCRHCAAAAPSRTCLVSPASSRRVKRRRAVT
ncbi:MAG: type II toxin-antitoxin system Phd/YefM family antitoxin [Actinomycetes bacterium]|jgi:prevent-host-death family protein